MSRKTPQKLIRVYPNHPVPKGAVFVKSVSMRPLRFGAYGGICFDEAYSLYAIGDSASRRKPA